MSATIYWMGKQEVQERVSLKSPSELRADFLSSSNGIEQNIAKLSLAVIKAWDKEKDHVVTDLIEPLFISCVKLQERFQEVHDAFTNSDIAGFAKDVSRKHDKIFADLQNLHDLIAKPYL